MKTSDPLKIYEPEFLVENSRVLNNNMHSAWAGLEKIIPSIIKKFNLNTRLAIEFGVWHGFSASALANYFDRVIGVDPFTPELTSCSKSIYESTRNALAPWPNIELVETGYFEFEWPAEPVDLIHIDNIHTYAHTFANGVLAMKHSRCIIFHDTEAFPEVRYAMNDLVATIKGFETFNYPHCCGLGIMVKT